MISHELPDPYIVDNNVDGLVLNGIRHVVQFGERINARAGGGWQAYNVHYVLTDSRDRLHCLRQPTSIKYFARELLAYFRGSLNVNDGLSQASKFWNHLANPDGQINSNYGHYVFRASIPDNEYDAKSQFDWLVALMTENPQTRRGFVNINDIGHKSPTLDFPCTIGLQSMVVGGRLDLRVLSRSTDVITGLPYDMGFFSFYNELLYAALIESGVRDIQLGHTRMDTSFTQIYDRGLEQAERLNKIEVPPSERCLMPPISSGRLVLSDIYNGTSYSDTIRWVYDNA